MNTRLCPIASILLAVLLGPTSASRSHAAAECDKGSPAGWFYFTSDPQYDYCRLQVEPDVDTVSVWVNAIPFQKARFTVPDPPFGSVVGESWLFPHTGDRASGLELDMGSCTEPGPTKLGEIYVSVGPGDPNYCAPWIEGDCEIQNCAGVWLPAQYIPQRAGGADAFDCICYGWQFCYSLPPYDLLPEDGASNVGTDVVLTWVAPEGWDGPNAGCAVYISTDPTCANVPYFVVPCDTDAFAPDFLEPGTTYYWRSSWTMEAQWGCGGMAAYQSFTTEPVTPVRTSTWGQVKAMYRD
jgi:hypothetical protein